MSLLGAHTYIVGAVEKSKDCDLNIEAYGYCYEKIILEATRLGLQTCWYVMVMMLRDVV